MKRMDNRQNKFFQFKSFKVRNRFLKYKSSKRTGKLDRRSVS